MTIIYHTFPSFYQSDSEILILGTMPSPKSRELGFYYMHPQNRFWHVLEIVFQDKIGKSIEEKKEFLIKHKIALWDTCASCEIDKASDSSIKNIKPNNISLILKNSNINKIYTTGKKAHELYQKYIYNKTIIEDICLYSPSPANCAISFDKLVENYKILNKNKNV